MTDAIDTKEARNPNIFFFRALVETMYAIQHHRIKVGNRIGAYEKMGMEKEKAEYLHKYMDQKLIDVESELKELIEKEVKGHPFWEYWLGDVRGIGPALGGSLIAAIEPISRFDNIAKLWRYAGQGVIDGTAEKMKRGEKIHWNPWLKMTCWKLGEQFVRQGDVYRKAYDDFKAEDRRKHPEPMATGKKSKEDKAIVLYSDGHIHARAKRKTVKLFLSHLWLKWRTMEGLPLTEPYVFAILKHSPVSYIPPPEKPDHI